MKPYLGHSLCGNQSLDDTAPLMQALMLRPEQFHMKKINVFPMLLGIHTASGGAASQAAANVSSARFSDCIQPSDD